MGLDRNLPDHVLKLIAPEERGGKTGPLRGNLGRTSEEAQAKYAHTTEVRDIHGPVKQWLGLHGILYVYARADKKSGIRLGWPDFTVIHGGKVICIEAKCPGRKLRPEQQQVAAELLRDGTPFTVAYSAAEAIAFVKLHLNPTLRD